MPGHDEGSAGGGGCNSIASHSSKPACGGKVTVLLISSLGTKGMAEFAVTPDGIWGKAEEFAPLPEHVLQFIALL